ncbi:MAG: hypothetical protein R3F61_09760 [Myxococcota bacterium]
MAELKTRAGTGDVQAFLDGLPEAQQRDARVLVERMQAATGAEPVLWGPSIVGFGTAHLVYETGREVDWFEVGKISAGFGRQAASILRNRTR